MSSDKAPEKVYYISTEKFGYWTTELKDGEKAVAFIREDLVPKQNHIPDADKMVDELANQPMWKEAREKYRKVEIDKEAKLASDWYNKGLNQALKINIKTAEEQRRREMFERVATIYMLYSKEYNGEAIKRICETALRDADKFAKGDE